MERGEYKEGKKKVKTWRKYGEKTLKGNQFIGMEITRCYYRCNEPGCNVKRLVEKAAWQSDDEAVVTISGKHSHRLVPPEESDTPAKTGNLVGKQMQEPWQEQPPPWPAPPSNVADRHTNIAETFQIPQLNKELSNEINLSSTHVMISDARQSNWPILFASPGFYRHTGYTESECIGRSWDFLHGTHSNPLAIEQIASACRRKQEIKIILLNYKKSGQPYWNFVHSTPVKDLQGNLISFVSIHMDVSLHNVHDNIMSQTV